MIVIRPTANLAKRMKVKLQSIEQTSNTKLGDWYAIELVLNRRQFILCVSSKSRLAVVMDAAPYATLPDRICDSVSEILRAIGVNEKSIQEERSSMESFLLAKTANKSILGTLNEYRYQLEYLAKAGRLNLNSPLEISIWLSKTISLVLPEGYQRDAALTLFGQELPARKQKSILNEKVIEFSKPKLYLVK